MGILIKRVEVNNYRSLKNVQFDLRKYNLFIGKNNSGKSNVLKAIDIAFSYINVDKEDLYLSENDVFDSRKEIVIDVLMKPSGDEEDFNNEWTSYLGEAIKQFIMSDNDYLAFRTVLKFDEIRDVFVNRKYLINSWENKIIARTNLNRGILERINSYFIDAKRDIFDDIRNKSSLWSKTTNNFDIPDDKKMEIESSLEAVNQQIIDNVEELSIIKRNLIGAATIPDSTIKVYPLTRDLDSLYKGMNIYYKSPNGTDVSVENNGMGTRSLAVLSSFKSFVEIEKKKYDLTNDVVYNLLLIEEPESHVHPHAQKYIYNKITEIDAQIITTSHSPYIVYMSDINDLMITHFSDAVTTVSTIDLNSLTSSEVDQISNHVLRTKGEILFSNIVVLCEGMTDELILPTFIESKLSASLDELGISLVGVEGQNYKPFVTMLESLNIPWVIFSDGEENTMTQLKNAMMNLMNISENEYENLNNIITIENGDDIESYLFQDYKVEIKNAIISEIGQSEYDFIKNGLSGKKRKRKYYSKFNNIVVRDYENEPPHTQVLDILYANKGKFGKVIAKTILSLDETRRIPSKIEELVSVIRNILDLRGEMND